jgi:hypothetical protein
MAGMTEPMKPEFSLFGNGGDVDFRAGIVRYQSGDRWELNIAAAGDYNYIATTIYMDDAVRLRDWLTQVIAVASGEGRVE